jgi:hypothetical protein
VSVFYYEDSAVGGELEVKMKWHRSMDMVASKRENTTALFYRELSSMTPLSTLKERLHVAVRSYSKSGAAQCKSVHMTVKYVQINKIPSS